MLAHNNLNLVELASSSMNGNHGNMELYQSFVETGLQEAK